MRRHFLKRVHILSTLSFFTSSTGLRVTLCATRSLHSVSDSLHKEPSSTSTRTGSTSRSTSTLRSGDPSEDSSFWLEPFFSPSSSVSSSDDEGDGSTDDSSTFKRPPRPGEGDTSQPASSTRGEGAEDDEELVYNDLEDDENQGETINVADELRRGGAPG